MTRQSEFESLLQDGHLSEVSTGLYVDALQRKTGANLPEEALQHVQECFECREKIVGLSSFLAGMGYTPSAEESDMGEPETQGPGMGQLYLRIAALIAFTIAAVWIVNFLMTRETPEGSSGLTESPAVQEPQVYDESGAPDPVGTAEPNAENFRVNETLESFVENPTRAGRDDAVLSPKNNEVITNRVQFAWKTSSVGPLSLAILDNRGVEVFRTGVTGDRFLLTYALVPGLYYWKLEEKDDVLCVGKFMRR